MLVDAFAGDTFFFFFPGATHSSANFSGRLVISAPEMRVPLSALQVWKSSVVLDQLACVDKTKIKIMFCSI